MTWTTPVDLKNQVQKLWDKGVLLAAMVDDAALFPLRLQCKIPESRELSERFPEVRDWIAKLSAGAGFYRIEWRSVNHRVLGKNDIPKAIWIDQLSDALGLIGKRRAAEQFAALLELTKEKQAKLLPWLAKRSLRALKLAEDWSRLLEMIAWLRQHPRPAIYLRQIDLPGVHTKWIEQHRDVLAELFDLVLPEDAIDRHYTGIAGFCRRYGFLDKPLRVRFRILDANVRLLSVAADQDMTLTKSAFAALDLPVSKIFITENEINFLAFPNVADAAVIFGAGYGFDHLATATWLHDKAIYYWGDIDTHGFAILNQLRGILPHAVSFLMDQRTLLAHKALWGVETKPETGTLARLSPEESELYNQLCQHHWGDCVRLEQERIAFDFLQAALQGL